MGPQPARLSRTLPKDFAFYSEPRTPERPAKELDVPPPPHHNSYRLRRPRLDILSTFEPKPMPFCSPDVPLPSIEVPEEPSAYPCPSSHTWSDAQSGSHLQVPSRERLEFRTPPAQIRDITQESLSFDDAFAYGHSISRPSSVCSTISNSSVSSWESNLSRPSVGGSCTSVESETEDPFHSYALGSRKEDLESPSKPRSASKTEFGPKRWTSEMDNHLWNTYQTYLQNPTITPFKTVPGSIPPLGVSRRVAREARRTWPKVKKGSLSNKVTKSRRLLRESDKVLRDGSTTPTAETPVSKSTWPRSNASTRRRLKELCKRKFNLTPHYQRILESRSPSPFPDLFSSSVGHPSHPWATSNRCNSLSFARDLGVSLISSSLPTSVAALPATTASGGFNDWLNSVASNPSYVPAPQSSQQSSSNAFVADPNSIPRLGSPFTYHTWGPDRLHRKLYRSASISHNETIHATGARLRSPIPEEIYAGAQKRRAVTQLEDEVSPNRSGVQPGLPELCDSHKKVNQRRVRLRNRGATTSAVNSRERLYQLFSPPSQFASSDAGSSSQTITAPVSQANDIKRLGSPFCIGRPRTHHGPSRSESFMADKSSPFGPHGWNRDL
ncbi:hypothetical protein VTO42DRAFT_266 [Malbranchea cinnamomea]